MSGHLKAIRSSWPWVVTAAAWILGASLAARLATLPAFSSMTGRPRSIAEQIFGRATSALAEYSFFDEADGFYHRGRRHYVDTAFTNDFFQIMRREIAPVGHAHLEGEQFKDVLAWVRIAMSLDPANMEYSLVAAYWLQREMGMTDAALEVLRESAEANPGAYEPHLGRGRLYTRLGDRARAKNAYLMALKRWPGADDPADEDTKIALREILMRLSIISEMDNDVPAAAGYLLKMVQLLPDSSQKARERLTALVRGQSPVPSASERWNTLRHEEDHHFCAEEEAGDSGHDHE